MARHRRCNSPQQLPTERTKRDNRLFRFGSRQSHRCSPAVGNASDLPPPLRISPAHHDISCRRDDDGRRLCCLPFVPQLFKQTDAETLLRSSAGHPLPHAGARCADQRNGQQRDRRSAGAQRLHRSIVPDCQRHQFQWFRQRSCKRGSRPQAACRTTYGTCRENDLRRTVGKAHRRLSDLLQPRRTRLGNDIARNSSTIHRPTAAALYRAWRA